MGGWMSLGRLPICFFLDTRAVPDRQAPAWPLTPVSVLRASDFLINLAPLQFLPWWPCYRSGGQEQGEQTYKEMSDLWESHRSWERGWILGQTVEQGGALCIPLQLRWAVPLWGWSYGLAKPPCQIPAQGAGCWAGRILASKQPEEGTDMLEWRGAKSSEGRSVWSAWEAHAENLTFKPSFQRSTHIAGGENILCGSHKSMTTLEEARLQEWVG